MIYRSIMSSFPHLEKGRGSERNNLVFSLTRKLLSQTEGTQISCESATKLSENFLISSYGREACRKFVEFRNFSFFSESCYPFYESISLQYHLNLIVFERYYHISAFREQLLLCSLRSSATSRLLAVILKKRLFESKKFKVFNQCRILLTAFKFVLFK